MGWCLLSNNVPWTQKNLASAAFVGTAAFCRRRAIAEAEDINVPCISGLYLLAGGSGKAADDKMRVDMLDERGRGPGGSPDVPIAIVLGMQTEEVASVTMSQTESGRVADNKRPKGLKLGKTRGHNICE